MILKLIIFILLTSLISSHGEEPGLKRSDEANKLYLASLSNKQKPAQQLKEPSLYDFFKKPKKSLSSDLDLGADIAKGIILKFKQWPGKKEKDFILYEVEKAGLKRIEELPFAKAWIYGWADKKLRNIRYADSICKKFSKLSSLKYCRSDLLAILESVGSSDFLHNPKYRAAEPKDNCNIICKDTAKCPYSLFGEPDFMDEPEEPDPHGDTHPYWAQRMIGADLIREELLQSKPKVENIFVAFDGYYERKENDTPHGIKVQNLISGLGEQAVLPYQFDEQKIRKESSQVEVHIDDMIKKAEYKCRFLNKTYVTNSREYTNCRKKFLPSYINYSVKMGYRVVPNPEPDELKKIVLYNPPVGSPLRLKYIKKWKLRMKFWRKRDGYDYKFERMVKLLEKDFRYLNEEGKKSLLELQEYIQKLEDTVYVKDDRDYESFKKLAPDTVVIAASGNIKESMYNVSHVSDTHVSEMAIRASQDYDAILVGSLSPFGSTSYFSMPHKEVHILAPSDQYIYSADKGGNREQFGGTSGAAPLVTGSLGAFTWLSGYSPTPEEAKELLKMTAIPTLSSNEKPRKNGVGMVNAYKLGRVGKELKIKCGTNEICFREKILDPSIYIFPEDQGLEDAVHQAFPECNPDCGGITNNSCQNKAEVFERLRKATFLNPSNKKLWTLLTCIHKHRNFKISAVGALNTYTALFGIGGPTKESGMNIAEANMEYVFQQPRPRPNGEGDLDMCKDDMDCVLVPPSKTGEFLPMTKSWADMYYALQQPLVLCNGKCRCNQTEKTGSELKEAKHRSLCKNSQCTLESKSFSKEKPVGVQPISPSSIKTPVVPLEQGQK